MKPIEIRIFGHTKQSSQEICSQLLDLERWSEFKGFFILPGIKSASFEKKPPDILGSRIKVQNEDGSSHFEEIIEWDVTRKVSLRFQEFDSPLKQLATHFIETWIFLSSKEWFGNVAIHGDVSKGRVGMVHVVANLAISEKRIF
jgi:hypothetical protein